MIINTNVSSLQTQNYLGTTERMLSRTMERLSSGKRINSSKDDAAGLAIASRMTGQLRGQSVAVRNASDGVSMLQTGEAALGSISNILQRMRELAVQADNGTYGDKDKDALAGEFNQLKTEIDNIASQTSFNGNQLLTGGATVKLHVGYGASDTMDITLLDVSSANLGTTATVTSLDIGSAAGDPTTAITSIDEALDTVSDQRASFGAYMNRLEFTIDNLNVSSTNLSASRSRVEDADMAAEMSELTKYRILSQSSIAMLSQANNQPQSILSLLQG